jgi:hypothetical protein
MALHDKIYVDFTDLLTVIESHRDTKHSTPECTVTEYVQRLRSIARVVTKRALLTDPDEL